MDFFLSLVIAGASVGAVYALIAVGLNFTFWTTRTLNFGQAAMMMICAMFTAVLSARGWASWAASMVAVVIVAAIGILVERLAVRPALKTAGSLGWVISTLGFGILLQGIMAMVYGSQPLPFPELLFKTGDIASIGGHPVSMQYAAIFVVSVATIVLLEALMRHTVLGTAVRAIAQDPELGAVQGLPVHWIVSGSFVASSVMAGVAGLLVSQIGGTIEPAFGFELVLMGFVAAVIGGMGHSMGALIGGIGIGILGKLVGGYVSSAAEHGIAFAVLVLMLALRPQGIFGTTEVSKA
ncbi:branched-chain amino acid ABC transporter permease [Variovorax sp. RHLX14]|uniref:branched-chain amino acid ABC transporter permease n=1 Tax=Variovorax sp. RHLX14 TaxID=1259731 RepID=UPI003F47FF5C